MFCRIIKRISFLVVFLLLITSAGLFAQNRDPLSHHITVNLPADSLIKTLRRIEQKSGTSFAFNPDLLRTKKSAAGQFSQEPLDFILTRILFGSGLDFRLVGNEIVITPVKPKIWTINGHIRDQANGEEMIGAIVQIPEAKAGVVTNQYGFYSLSVPEGDYGLKVSYPGYQVRDIRVHLDSDHKLEIELSLQLHHLAEVEISNSKVTPNPILLNEQNLNVRQLNGAAYYAGEKDVLKRLQMQNGIKAITEGSSGLFVRGGNSDQNLILLDEATIYNPSHLYGLVSVFNSDAVNNVQLYRD